MKNHKEILKQRVLKNGWEFVSDHIGFDNLYRIAFNNDYNEFLKLFENMEIKVDDTKLGMFESFILDDKVYMILSNGYDSRVMTIFPEIWEFFGVYGVGLQLKEVNEILKEWVNETYNIKDFGIVFRWNENI
jgi:hypothetical protein